MRTIIHIFSSLDGRIAGSFMAMAAAAPSRKAYARMREAYGADAILYGSVTARAFAGDPPARPSEDVRVPEGDYLGVTRRGPDAEYLVVLDPQGEVWWEDPVLCRAGRPDAVVVEVVTSATPQAFLAHLREVGIPYLVAGDEALDCALMAEKLERRLGVKTLLVCGGGKADQSLLEAGCVDEVSIVMAPVASGETNVATIFDRMSAQRGASVPLELSVIERTDGDGVHLVYRVPN